MRVPPAPFDDGDHVGDLKAIRVGKKSARATVAAFHRPVKVVRLCQSHICRFSLASNSATENRSDPPIPRRNESLRAE